MLVILFIINIGFKKKKASRAGKTLIKFVRMETGGPGGLQNRRSRAREMVGRELKHRKTQYT